MLSVLLLALLPADLPPQALTFRGPNDWTFDGRVHVPEEVTGPAVLLIGGGIGNDLDWTAPGTLSIGGSEEQITITGKDHADAPRLVKPLVATGCVVMQYSTIAREDPKRDRYPYELGLTDPKEIMDLARAAMDALAAHPAASQRPLVVLGFSMGAQRAVQLASERDAIAAIVLLSGAQLTATSADDTGGNMHRVEATKMLASLDADGDQVVSGNEFPSEYDFDHDGILRHWEVSAALAAEARSHAGTLPTHDRFGLPFGESVLEKLQRPTLAVYGTLDDMQAYHAPNLANRWAWVDVRVLPELGHQLGPELEGRIGPIDESVCEIIATWLSETVRDKEYQQPCPQSPRSFSAIT